MSFNSDIIRKDFPILNRYVNNLPLIYFDNAATSQKPQVVIDSLTHYYSYYNANIHRGVHTISQQATDAYENARKIIQNHIHAKEAHEVIFTSGTTESINLVANGFKSILTSQDEIIVSALEHHSNIVPWQMLCEQTKATLKVIPMNNDGTLDIEKYKKLVSKKTKLVACNHVSNALGIINPIEIIIEQAHKNGAAILIDGAQSCPHLEVNMQSLNVDFYTGSAHKMCGPTGVGFLYGKTDWLEKLPPYQGGGEMIEEVTFEKTTYAKLPHKFEAGTTNIAGGIAFGEAINYLNKIGISEIASYEHKLLDYATKKLLDIKELKIYGIAEKKASVISFNLQDIHPYDVGSILDKLGIAVRTGHHCAQPIMAFYNIPGTVRASFAFYNTFEEIDKLVEGIRKVQQMLS